MNGLTSLAVGLCYLFAGVAVFTALAPQKRTGRIFSFVIGLFIIVSLISAVGKFLEETDLSFDTISDIDIEADFSERDYIDAVAEKTVDDLVEVTNELLIDEGIFADDIRINIKISDNGRIYIDRVDIYINEDNIVRKEDIKSIVYRNLSKEPYIYVKGKVQ